MADSKKYYYLKLKDNFFDSDEIKVLEGMENGYKYSNILLKMYLKSIKRDGLLIFNERIPYDEKMIATVTGHNTNDVIRALELFTELGLIDRLSDGAIYMLDIQNFIGKSSTEADRIREYRSGINKRKQELIEPHSDDEIVYLPATVQMYDECTPEIEKEIDIETKKDKEVEREQKRLERLQLPTRGEFDNVHISDVEYGKAVKRYGEKAVESILEDLSGFIETDKRADKYTNHYRALLKWLKRDYQELSEIEEQKQKANEPDWEVPEYDPTQHLKPLSDEEMENINF